MNRDLQEGHVLRDRFVLKRCLRGGGLSHLWLAQDAQLDVHVLLQVYHLAGSPAGELLEKIKRDARRYRRIRHPHVARIHDVHESEDVLLVSIEHQEGELLSVLLEEQPPLPFARLIERVRPLADALMHLHERGGEHGRLDPDHLLVDDEGRWILLPADGTRPVRSDMLQLGDVMVALLTGGHAPTEGRQLNDVAERLHAGRTVPALLNQLVEDLGMADPAQRPAGMRDVLRRLDQLEAYLTPAPEEAPDAPEPTVIEPRVPTADATRPRVRHRRTKRRAIRAPVIWTVIGGAGILVGALLLRPAAPEQRPDAQTPVAATTGQPGQSSDAAPAPVEPPVDPARLAAEKLAAEEALNRYLTARRQVEEIGAAMWAGEPYQTGAVAAVEADAAYLAEDYVGAAGHYDRATAAFELVVESKGEALAGLLVAGAEALEAPDAEKATAAFKTALLIDPGNEQAAVGLRRAETLDELHRLLASGSAHENEGRLDFAHADFAAAVQLDPLSPAAAAAYQRIKDRIADDQFRRLMADGLEAYHRGDYAEARVKLGEAQRFRADAPEVAAALEMVREAELLAEVRRLRELAAEHERQEQWQEAWNAYRQVLVIDPAFEFAQHGKTRSEEMITLEERTGRYLADPELLTRPGAREDATRLLERLGALREMGPRLRQSHADLAEQVRLANTPLRVVLRSDEKTEVDVYRVGRYGSFKSVELELLPGVYTVVGHRKGYKDVRLTLRLKPGEKQATLEVVCTESI